MSVREIDPSELEKALIRTDCPACGGALGEERDVRIPYDPLYGLAPRHEIRGHKCVRCYKEYSCGWLRPKTVTEIEVVQD